MRLHRFYTEDLLTSILFYKNETHLHQWRNVFRLEVGDTVILFGDGFEHEYQIKNISKKEAELAEKNKTPSRFQKKQITLALALIKKDNFELAIQKCTELGVTEILPILSDRSERAMYGKDRLQKILIEAAEQSGWGAPPKLLTEKTFERLLEEAGEKVLFCHTGGEILQPDVCKNKSIILIGPEGGFSEREIAVAEKLHVQKYTIPTGVLRAETAAISLITLGIIFG